MGRRRKAARRALRHVPVLGKSARREYAEAILAEPPPESPTAPYSPEPPAWMISPVPVLDPSTDSPVYWMDEAPYEAWTTRRGKAAYELKKESVLDRLRSRETQEDEERPDWAGPAPFSRNTPMSVINHPANRLTVKQRQERGLTEPWNRRPMPKTIAEPELPEVECCWAPWWLE
ncbi:hypothetical protein [Streptomyces sp. NPDC047974]|uniref:hypothetical protein n=1 Tax=Streptomyces sp. NPDC047974 TaxID=3154343 RepID=UPI003403966C